MITHFVQFMIYWPADQECCLWAKK